MDTATQAEAMGDTSIRVSEELADELYDRKGRSTSYEEFIWELIERVDGGDERDVGSETRRQSAEGSQTQPLAQQQHRDDLRDGLAGSGDLLERRVDAIIAMYDVLREQGEAEKEELLDAVDVDATGYASRASVWSNMVKGKETLSELPGVESPPIGRSEWRYTDD